MSIDTVDLFSLISYPNSPIPVQSLESNFFLNLDVSDCGEGEGREGVYGFWKIWELRKEAWESNCCFPTESNLKVEAMMSDTIRVSSMVQYFSTPPQKE